MARQSPITDLHSRAEAVLAPYGPHDAPIAVVLTYGDLAAEYAAIRKACILLDLPQRGTLLVSGKDASAFLQRMVTQDLKDMPTLSVRRSFWLNRKGRIDADLRIIRMPDGFLFDLDAHAAARASAGLAEYIIADDVALTDLTEQRHRFALHGPGSAALLARFSTHAGGATLDRIQPGQVALLKIAGREVIADRADTAGEIGLELLVRTEDARSVYEALIAAAHEHGDDPARPNPRPPLRPAGWLAYNTARIEAGTPFYNLDFGPDSLPAETGVLQDRVSFTKGCYLGQEIVARMNALGHPRQTLVAVRLDALPADAQHQPETGASVFAADPADASKAAGEPIGAVTSCTISPMLSQTVIAFSMVKWAAAKPGSRVLIDCAGEKLAGAVQPALRFLPVR